MNMQFASSFKYAKFGRGASYIESRNGNPLELAQIAEACPSVLAVDKHRSRSERYTYVSTMQVLEALGAEGFQPFSIMQGGSKDEEKRGFTKHLIRLRSDSAVRRLHGSAFEVCFLGSHDGTTSNQLYGGFLRFACKNGTIFFDGEASCIKVSHVGNIVPEVIEGAYQIVERGSTAIEHVNNFRQITLNRDERRAFAAAAIPLRFPVDVETNKVSPVEPEALLAVHRSEDRADDLWTAFNVIQENVIRGGLSYQGRNAQGRRVNRSTRAVRSVDGNVNLNRSLWILAEEMAKIKSAA